MWHLLQNTNIITTLVALSLALASLSAQLDNYQVAHAEELSTQVIDLPAYATKIAEENHINASHFLAVINCESQWNALAVGDKGTSFGLLQIHLPAHPDITEAQAEDPQFAIPWAAKQWAEGNYQIWSCWSIEDNNGWK